MSQPRDSSKASLAAQVRAISSQYSDRPVFLHELVQSAQGRGYDLLLILLSLPFLTPIPLPLLSTPFGLVITFAGMRLALGRKPWWPQWLLRKQIPPKFFPTLLRAAGQVIGAIEYFVKPRLQVFHDATLFQRCAGGLIAVSGLFLLLPLPVPFSNFFPALTIVLLASGALERDGLFFLMGCAAFCVSASYLMLLSVGGVEAISRIFH